jgi:hypothetical protein
MDKKTVVCNIIDASERLNGIMTSLSESGEYFKENRPDIILLLRTAEIKINEARKALKQIIDI